MRPRLGWLVMALVLLGRGGAMAQEDAPLVTAVEVKFVGSESVNRAIVFANIQTVAGKPLSRQLVEQDVRNLIHTGYFFDVRVLEEPAVTGVKVIFQVQGKASIKEIQFEGAKRFKVDRVITSCDAPISCRSRYFSQTISTYCSMLVAVGTRLIRSVR